jgi:hypothetical protein
VFKHVRLERCRFRGLQCMHPITVWRVDHSVEAESLRPVLRYARRIFLIVCIIKLGMCLHDNARQRAIHSGQPRAFARDVAAFFVELLGGFAKIPDGAGVILGKIVKRLLGHPPVDIDGVEDDKLTTT